MPLYGFECEDCGYVFEVRASIQEKEAGLKPKCPQCHSAQTRQVITAGAVVRGGRVDPSGSCCGPNSGWGCCG